MQAISEKMSLAIAPVMKAHKKAINFQTFQTVIQEQKRQMDHLKKIYDSSPWESIVKQQLATEKIILGAFAKVDTTGLQRYRKFFFNLVCRYIF